MSEFDRQNADFFPAIHANHRRSSTTQTIGYIVTGEQAQRFAAYEASQRREGDGLFSLVLLAAQLFALVTAAVVALA